MKNKEYLIESIKRQAFCSFGRRCGEETDRYLVKDCTFFSFNHGYPQNSKCNLFKKEFSESDGTFSSSHGVMSYFPWHSYIYYRVSECIELVSIEEMKKKWDAKQRLE